MKNYALISLSVMLPLLLSCTHRKESISKYKDATSICYEDFVSNQKLHETTLLSDQEVLKPLNIYTYDTLLITVNPQEKKLLHLFSLKSRKEIGERISMGQGPNDMIRPSIVQCNAEQLLIFDAATFTLFTYNTHDFITNANVTPIDRKKLDLQLYGEVGILSNGIIGSTGNPQYQFIKFDKTGNKVGEFGHYPVVSDITYTNNEKLHAFQSSFITNTKDRIVVCYKWTDLIEIFDENGQLLKRIHGPEHSYARFEEYHQGNVISSHPDKMNKDAYFNPCNAGDEFFVLFNGKVWDSEAESQLDRILVFSWDGTPKKIYTLDKGIINFTVDVVHKKIYGISSEPEFHIVEFSYD